MKFFCRKLLLNIVPILKIKYNMITATKIRQHVVLARKWGCCLPLANVWQRPEWNVDAKHETIRKQSFVDLIIIFYRKPDINLFHCQTAPICYTQ